MSNTGPDEMATGRWIRLNTKLGMAGWTAELDRNELWAFVRILCHAKEHGAGGAFALTDVTPGTLRSWRVPLKVWESMLHAAQAHGAVRVERETLIIENWTRYQVDPTNSARQGRFRRKTRAVTRRNRYVTAVTIDRTGEGQDRTGQDKDRTALLSSCVCFLEKGCYGDPPPTPRQRQTFEAVLAENPTIPRPWIRAVMTTDEARASGQPPWALVRHARSLGKAIVVAVNRQLRAPCEDFAHLIARLQSGPDEAWPESVRVGKKRYALADIRRWATGETNKAPAERRN